jgi:hypothetical protein
MQKTKANTVLAIFLVTFAVMLIGGLIVIGDGYHYFSAIAQPQSPPQFQLQQPFTPSPSPIPSPSQPGMVGPFQPPPQQQSPIDPQSVEFLTYENRTAKVRFDYPSHWQQITPQPPDVVAFTNPQTGSFTALSITQLPQGTTLEQTITEKVNYLSSIFPGFQYIGGQPATIDGKSAYNILYSFSDAQGNSFMGTNGWTVSEDIDYDFRYMAPSNLFASDIFIANHMTETLDILDSWFE